MVSDTIGTTTDRCCWIAMLTLTSQQMERFKDAQVKRYCLHLADRAHSRHPDTAQRWGRDELATRLEPDILLAHSHGLKTAGHLERYSDLALVLGFGFGWAQSWAGDILALDLPAAHKLDRLEETAVFILQGG